MSPTPVVGVIGTGAMGAPMALHLLREHGAVHFTARRALPRLSEAGATAHATARELAEACQLVLLMLPDLPQIREVIGGPDGLLAGVVDERELLLVVGSTCSAPGVRELDREVRAATGGRVRVVDAPVSGGEDGAKAGNLSIMMGGSEADCTTAAAALAPCGSSVRLGEIGAGQVAKACNQLVVSATILALGEASVLAERSGLDTRAMWDLLDGGYAGSRLLTTRKERLITGDDSPSGAAAYLLKDLRSGLEVAADSGTRAHLLPALEATFSAIVDAGLGERDMSVTRTFIARESDGA